MSAERESFRRKENTRTTQPPSHDESKDTQKKRSFFFESFWTAGNLVLEIDQLSDRSKKAQSRKRQKASLYSSEFRDKKNGARAL